MAKHTDFVSAMRQQLAQQVLRFLSKKELEIDLWVEAELKAWQQAMNYDDSTQVTLFPDSYPTYLPTIYPSMHLPIHLPIHLSIYLYVYPC